MKLFMQAFAKDNADVIILFIIVQYLNSKFSPQKNHILRMKILFQYLEFYQM